VISTEKSNEGDIPILPMNSNAKTIHVEVCVKSSIFSTYLFAVGN